jgi:hypothetical protein
MNPTKKGDGTMKLTSMMLAVMAMILLSACAALGLSGGDARSRWANAQVTYTAGLTQLVDGRTSCVGSAANPDYGPDHPRCLISDRLYEKIEPVRASADQCLVSADLAIIAGDEASASSYVACAEGAAAALITYLITE